MVYFDKVKLKNVTCFSEKTLSLEKIQIIYGPTRSGKTSLFRAFKFCIYNYYHNTLRRKKTRKTKVHIRLNNDYTISRVISDTGSYYLIFPPGEKSPKKLTNLNLSTIPDEISNLFNMDKINLDGSNYLAVNLKARFDFPFGVGIGPVNMFRLLGKVAGVKDYDFGLKEAESELRNLNQEIGEINKRISRLESRKQELSNLKQKAESWLKKLEELQQGKAELPGDKENWPDKEVSKLKGDGKENLIEKCQQFLKRIENDLKRR